MSTQLGDGTTLVVDATDVHTATTVVLPGILVDGKPALCTVWKLVDDARFNGRLPSRASIQENEDGTLHSVTLKYQSPYYSPARRDNIMYMAVLSGAVSVRDANGSNFLTVLPASTTGREPKTVVVTSASIFLTAYDHQPTLWTSGAKLPNTKLTMLTDDEAAALIQPDKQINPPPANPSSVKPLYTKLDDYKSAVNAAQTFSFLVYDKHQDVVASNSSIPIDLLESYQKALNYAIATKKSITLWNNSNKSLRATNPGQVRSYQIILE